MKIYTSYFARTNKIPEEFTKIGIARYLPEFFAKDESCHWMPALAPSPELLRTGKNNQDKSEYIRRYKAEVLGVLNPDEVVKHIGHNGVLMCYEREGDFCHRNLIADWLRDHGYDVSEYNERE